MMKMRVLRCLMALGFISVVAIPSGNVVTAGATLTPAVQVVSQEFEVVDSTTLSLVVRVTASGEELKQGDLKLRLIERATSYESFGAAQDDLNAEVIDQVNFKTASLSRTVDGDHMVFVRIDRTGDDREGLNIRESGVYPLAVVFQSGDARVAQTIFIHVVSSTDPAPTRLPTTFVANMQSAPVTQPDGSALLSASTQEQIDRLINLVNNTQLPMIIGIGPEIFEGLANEQNPGYQVLLRQMRRTLSAQTLVAQPYVSIDPSGAARAGLTSEFTRQMRLGEDTTTPLFSANPTKRQIWIADKPLDSFGANLIRDNGAQTAILLPTAVENVAELGYQPLTEMAAAALTGGSSINIATVDPFIAKLLSQETVSPSVDAATAMAHVVVASEMAMADEVSNQLFLSTEDGSLPSTETMNEFVALIAESDHVQLADEIPTRQGSVPYPLPDRTAADLSGVATAVNLLNLSVIYVGSMLPPDSPLLLSWSMNAARAVSNRLAADERSAYIAAVSSEIETLLEKIVIPSEASFTLPEKDGEIRLQIRNDAEIDLSVRVRLVSTKLAFPNESTVVLLRAGSTTDVAIPVRARSNGRFGVELQVTTPQGNTFVAPPTTLSARVTALAGIGQVVSVVLLLLILTWWVAHIRRNRRTALEQGTVL